MTAGAVALGIDIGGTKLVAATIAADGAVLERRRRRTPAQDPDELVRTVRELAAELDTDGRLPVGIGIAGMVDADGVVRYGPNIAVRDLPLAAIVGETTGTTVAVVNDANAAVLAEQRIGAAAGHDEVLLFTLGTGVGGGVVLGGELQLGAHGLAGELGHLVVHEGGRPCPCGNRGCVEAYASGTAIELLARERLVDHDVSSALRGVPELTGRAVTDAANEGDAVAQGILTEVGTWIGVAAAGVVNLLDTSVVLVGGGAGAAVAPWALPAARAAMADRLLGVAHRQVPTISLTALGDDAGMIGAAILAAERAGAPAPASS